MKLTKNSCHLMKECIWQQKNQKNMVILNKLKINVYQINNNI